MEVDNMIFKFSKKKLIKYQDKIRNKNIKIKKADYPNYVDFILKSIE